MDNNFRRLWCLATCSDMTSHLCLEQSLQFCVCAIFRVLVPPHLVGHASGRSPASALQLLESERNQSKTIGKSRVLRREVLDWKRSWSRPKTLKNTSYRVITRCHRMKARNSSVYRPYPTVQDFLYGLQDFLYGLVTQSKYLQVFGHRAAKHVVANAHKLYNHGNQRRRR